MKLLIVEDEELIRDAYKMILESEGHEVYTAHNGVEALREMKVRRPKLVLLDVFMPVMDGMTFLKNLDLDEYPNSTFIACTNLSDQETKEEMLRLGCTDIILKANIDPRELIEIVKTYA